MISNIIQVTVKNVAAKNEKVYFSRCIKNPTGEIDVNVILRALSMLFSSELFKITVETYGA